MTTMRERQRPVETVRAEITQHLATLMQSRAPQAAAHGAQFAELWGSSHLRV